MFVPATRLKQRQVIAVFADAAEGLGGPQRLAPVEAERAEGIGIGEPLDHMRWKVGAQPEIADGNIAGSAVRHDGVAVLLREALDLAEAQSQRVSRPYIARHVAVGRMHILC